LKRLEVLLTGWSARNEEHARQAKDDLFAIQNTRKARDGELAALYDPVLMGRKAEAEQKLKLAFAAKPEFAMALAAYDRIATAERTIAEFSLRYRLLESAHAFDGTLFRLARLLLRSGEESVKANADRLPEFRDSRRAWLEQELFSEQPIYDDYERLRLTASLTFMVEKLGFTDPIVQAVLAGKSPAARAEELVAGTQVKDLAFRRRLYAGGTNAVNAANDPMIELARTVDAEARSLYATLEVQAEVQQQAHAAISQARYALQGASFYPDATGTLRLAFGVVKGYEEGGRPVPAMTTFAGLYQRAAEMKDRPPFDLPNRWLKKKSALDLAMPLNFVATHDIGPGNSGSPMVSRAGELVGVVFDGNVHSFVWNFLFDGKQARCLCVYSGAVLEALRKVYGTDSLADELVAGGRDSSRTSGSPRLTRPAKAQDYRS
jgi:hypothetical protein